MKSLSFLFLVLVCFEDLTFANQCIDDLGRVFEDGEEFLCDDGCNNCFCQADGSILQTEAWCGATGLCKYGDKILNSGESVLCTDGCNRCTCSDGTIFSTEKWCGE